jgi:hypothetical protein
MALVFAVAVGAGDEAPWFDMENCAFCRHLTEPPEMLQSLGWEHHNISNGIVSISTIPEKYAEAYDKAMGMMKETGEKAAQGAEMHTCGMCGAMGALMAKGAKYETVKTDNGYVALMTSDDPEIVTEIQAWGKKTNEELAKMEASMMEGDMGDMHEGH